MLRRAVAWLVVVVAIVAVVRRLLGYYRYAQIQTAIAAGAAFPEAQESVEAATVHRGEWAASARAVGTVVALRQVQIRNELAGTVAEIGFKSGDIVEAGQLLVRFDTRQEQASLDAARAEAELARLTYERRKKLRASQTVSAQELDEAQQQLHGRQLPGAEPAGGHRQEDNPGAVPRPRRPDRSAARRLSGCRQLHRHAAGRRR